MPKYIEKQDPVEAYQFTEDMVSYWIVEFEGEFYNYYEKFKTKQDADNYIKSNGGIEKLYDMDKDLEIKYKKPSAIIVLDNNDWDIKVSDYIITDFNGKKSVMDKVKFEKKYKLVEE